MSPVHEIVGAGVFGVAGGILSGFLGVGGGAILPPLFTIVLGFEQHRAQGISLAALLPPVGLPAVVAYRKIGVPISAARVALLVIGFLLGGLAGASLAHRVPARELRWVFAAFLGVSAGRAWLAARRTAARAEEPMKAATSRPILGLPIGLAAGVVSGLLGAGGGIIALPLLRRVAGLSRLEAQATTLAMMLPPIALPAVLVYAKEGGLSWDLLVAVAGGFALGAGAGARLAGRLNARVGALVYALFLASMAIALVLRG